MAQFEFRSRSTENWRRKKKEGKKKNSQASKKSSFETKLHTTSWLMVSLVVGVGGADRWAEVLVRRVGWVGTMQ